MEGRYLYIYICLANRLYLLLINYPLSICTRVEYEEIDGFSQTGILKNALRHAYHIGNIPTSDTEIKILMYVYIICLNKSIARGMTFAIGQLVVAF